MFVCYYIFLVLVPSNELYQQSLSLLTELINQWKQNPEIAMEHSSQYSNLPFVYSVDAIKNTRKKMEDRHIVLHDLNKTLDINVSENLFLFINNLLDQNDSTKNNHIQMITFRFLA